MYLKPESKAGRHSLEAVEQSDQEAGGGCPYRKVTLFVEIV